MGKNEAIMRIFVYGLGIIGASVAASLKRAGHFVIGRNRSSSAVRFALEHGYIDESADTYLDADVVILALPPRVAMRELGQGNFPSGAIISDICGVKSPLLEQARKRGLNYVGMHPMAGKETTGIASADPALFCGKNLIVVREGDTDLAAAEKIVSLGRDMGFSRIVECTAAEHDRMIALTSQLAHIVSNGYIKTEDAPACLGFTGGSFQDMTRIASLDEEVWTELFFLNKANLEGEISRLISKLSEYLAALTAGDEDGMRALLSEGKRYHQSFLDRNRPENCEKISPKHLQTGENDV